MNTTFKADEIFEMAEQIERNGAKFYRQAAERTSDKQTKQLLLDLADMEAEHLKIFKEMRSQLAESEKSKNLYDPDNQASLYLKAMADLRGWEGKASPTAEITGGESLRDIIESALTAEKDSVVFYFGLKSFVSAKSGKDKIEAIIKEELGHIACLSQKLQEIL